MLCSSSHFFLSLSHLPLEQFSLSYSAPLDDMICFRLTAFLSIFFIVISFHRSILVRATPSPLDASSLLGSAGGAGGLTNKLPLDKTTGALGKTSAVTDKLPLSMPKVPAVGGTELLGGLTRSFGAAQDGQQSSNGGSLAGLAKRRRRSVTGAQRERLD